jgi:ribonuclease HI
MELQAAIQALKGIKRSSSVSLTSDYLIRGTSSWRAEWKRNQWQTAGRKPVANKDLWEQLDALASRQHCQMALDCGPLR